MTNLLEAGKVKSAAYEETIARLETQVTDQNKIIDQLKAALKNSKQENKLLQEHNAQEQENFKRKRFVG